MKRILDNSVHQIFCIGNMRMFIALVFVFLISFENYSGTTCADDGGYLFATFKGEQTPLTEQIFFAVSRNGKQWKALNQGNPSLVSDLGEKGVRDPFLIRSHDGRKVFAIATDLSIHLTKHDWGRAVTKGSRNIAIWETENLIDWQGPRLVTVAPEDAGCTWAPEAIYDVKLGDYLVFWASTTGRDEFKKHRIWASRTKDFRNFGKPFIYIENESTVIDTNIVFENGIYYRFSKDERTKAISLEQSRELMGNWKLNEDFSLKDLQGYEGPACYLLEAGQNGAPGSWCLLIDHYAKGRGYQPYVTHDLGKGKFESTGEIKFPFRFRHGSVLKISEDEYQRLVE